MKKVVMNKRFGSEVSPNSVPFSVRATQQVSTHYICDVFGAFENLSDIEETLFVLGIAEEQDLVTLRLNSVGGCHTVGDALIMAMNNCAAPIHVQGSGIIASYATFVLLQAHSFELSPFTDILCHSASFGYGGKMSETKDAVDFQYRQADKMIRHYYEGFFNEDELERIIGGYEHFMDSDEFITRFTDRNNYLEAMMQEAQCGEQQCEECSRDMYECSCGMTAENQIPVSPEKEAEIDKSLGVVRQRRKPPTSE